VPDVDSARFRSVLGCFPTGVTVVTATDDTPVGLSVGAFFSVSLHPPLVGFCVQRSSRTWPRIQTAGTFCVNMLPAHHEGLSRRFAATGLDRFDGLGWEPTATGAPRLVGALAWIECRIDAVHPAGDHDLCVGQVLDLGEEAGDAGPLVFFRGRYGTFAP
jgi:3-hydroxy-9,10-secoandrosta-1,3,5(10)-triene-9,17-dione monooxygenase reductase component